MLVRPLRLRQGRKFPPRKSNEELAARMHEAMDNCGVQGHLQAEYESEAARLAIGSTDWRLGPCQPNLKLYGDEPWAGAYSAVVAFLKQYDMGITLETLSIEAQGGSLPEWDDFLADETAADCLWRLARVTRTFDFQTAVNDFAAPADDYSPAPQPVKRAPPAAGGSSDSDRDAAPVAPPSIKTPSAARKPPGSDVRPSPAGTESSDSGTPAADSGDFDEQPVGHAAGQAPQTEANVVGRSSSVRIQTAFMGRTSLQSDNWIQRVTDQVRIQTAFMGRTSLQSDNWIQTPANNNLNSHRNLSTSLPWCVELAPVPKCYAISKRN
jgi:hypothetical protein